MKIVLLRYYYKYLISNQIKWFNICHIRVDICQKYISKEIPHC